jgi:glycosyltransferase involved in cell wall biosynthesis
MKIAYITVAMPYGKGEQFFIEEVKEIIEQGVEVIIIPRSPYGKVINKDADSLLPYTIKKKIFHFSFIKCTLIGAFRNPSAFFKILLICFKSQNFIVFIKNLTIIPKSYWIARVVKKQRIDHIYSSWALSTATMAMFCSLISGKSWSFAAHSSDILENNLLKEKIKDSSFVRFISENWIEKAFSVIGERIDNKVIKIHLGVKIPKEAALSNSSNYNEPVNIIWPANFLPVKNHLTFLDGFKSLSENNFHYQLLLAGDGPLRKEIEKKICQLGIEDNVRLLGYVHHPDLINFYKFQKVDIAVLPSAYEGIPVSLMEAMSYNVPVISTDVGGVNELIGGGHGVLIPANDVERFSSELKKLISEKNYRIELGKTGRIKIEQDFNVKINVQRFISHIQNYIHIS